jgi:hypothetical protein
VPEAKTASSGWTTKNPRPYAYAALAPGETIVS